MFCGSTRWRSQRAIRDHSRAWGDARKGRRPSFIDAAPPELADRLYQELVTAIKLRGMPVQTGRFREMMQVALVNDGPVTLWIETPG